MTVWSNGFLCFRAMPMAPREVLSPGRIRMGPSNRTVPQPELRRHDANGNPAAEHHELGGVYSGLRPRLTPSELGNAHEPFLADLCLDLIPPASRLANSRSLSGFPGRHPTPDTSPRHREKQGPQLSDMGQRRDTVGSGRRPGRARTDRLPGHACAGGGALPHSRSHTRRVPSPTPPPAAFPLRNRPKLTAPAAFGKVPAPPATVCEGNGQGPVTTKDTHIPWDVSQQPAGRSGKS